MALAAGDIARSDAARSRRGCAMMRVAIHAVAAHLALIVSTGAHSRPVTFPGGSMSMTEVDGSDLSTQIDHTRSRQDAIGAAALTEADGDRRSAGALVNVLLVRRNTANSQTNAYLIAGGGPSWVRRDGEGRDTVSSGFVGAEADWETRRWFVGAAAKLSLIGDDAELGWRARLGVAPYVADSGSLHTWTMIQVGRAAVPGRTVEVTPLVRLFKGDILAEAGLSHRGSAFGTLWFYF